MPPGSLCGVPLLSVECMGCGRLRVCGEGCDGRWLLAAGAQRVRGRGDSRCAVLWSVMRGRDGCDGAVRGCAAGSCALRWCQAATAGAALEHGWHVALPWTPTWHLSPRRHPRSAWASPASCPGTREWMFVLNSICPMDYVCVCLDSMVLGSGGFLKVGDGPSWRDGVTAQSFPRCSAKCGSTGGAIQCEKQFEQF